MRYFYTEVYFTAQCREAWFIDEFPDKIDEEDTLSLRWFDGEDGQWKEWLSEPDTVNELKLKRVCKEISEAEALARTL